MVQTGAEARSLSLASTTRIVVFVADLSPTGVTRNAYLLAEALGVDHEVELIACGGGAMTGTMSATILVDSPRFLRIDAARAAWRLRRRLIRRAPALVISVGIRGHAVLVAALSGLREPRRIYRISNDLGHAGTRRGVNALSSAAQTAAVIADANRLVLVSHRLLDDPRLARAAARGRVTVIENGVDVDEVRRRAAEPADPNLYPAGDLKFVLGIGSLYPQKNFPMLIAAVAAANAVRPLGLVILGVGSDAARTELLRLAAEAGIADRFLLPGYAANPFSVMTRAAAFALPSFWEGASNALLEALAIGVPIIASPGAGNAATVLGNGEFGLLADPRDVAAWTSAVLSQTGPEPLRPGNRADHYRLSETLAAWRALVTRELAAPDRR